MNKCTLHDSAQGLLVRRDSEASARGTNHQRKVRRSLQWQAAIPRSLWTLLLRQGGSHRVGSSVYKHHFGSYHKSKSEPHGPLALPSWPVSELWKRNPNFTYRGGFPSKPSTDPLAPVGHSWSPFKPGDLPRFEAPAVTHAVACGDAGHSGGSKGSAHMVSSADTSSRIRKSCTERSVVHSSDAPIRPSTGRFPQYAFTGY